MSGSSVRFLLPLTMASLHYRVLADLGRALSLELSAVQQYMTQAGLLSQWGDQASADRFRHEVVEEMQHAERIVQHMLKLGVAPGSSQLQPVVTAGSLEELLRGNSRLEQSLVDHYAAATDFCVRIGDTENADFFRGLLAEEQAHGQEVLQWLAELMPPSGR